MKTLLTIAVKAYRLPFVKLSQYFLFAMALLPFTALGQLPTSFQKVELLTGLTNAVNFEFAPDGRVFIVDRYGELLVYKPNTQTTVSAGTISVFRDMEDGLLAIAFDPQFTTNGFVYLHYSHPSLPKNRVSRFKMEGDKLNLSSEVVLLEWQSDRNGYFHSAGDMDFDSKGNLYIATGDNTNHSAYSTLDETDPNLSAERTSSNTNDLRGKILRIKPQSNGTYSIPEGNLFPNGTGGRPEIYVMGARNPFKIFVDKATTDWLFWSDVGPDANSKSNLGPMGMDEINLTKGAANHGWPYFAGKNEPYLNTYANPNFFYDPNSPVNMSKWNTGTKNLPPAKSSWLEFFHKCYLAGPRYYYSSSINNPKKLPSDFHEAFFYYDFNTSNIWVVKMDANGNPVSTQQLTESIKGAGFIDLKIGPDGQLYILEYGAGCCPGNVGSGKLVRVDYTGSDSNKAPDISIQADVTSGALPLTVNFSSEGTTDPNGDAMTYAWDFQGDGVIDSNLKNPAYTYTQKGVFNALLRVSDSKGASSSKSIKIYAGNHAATFKFVSPLDGGMINWGDDLSYDIVVNDQEDGSTANGTISCSKLNLVPSFGHLTHSHDGMTINQCKGTFNLNPMGHNTQGEDDIYYVFKVNYTDTDGLTSFDQVTVHPKVMEAEFYDLQSSTSLVANTDKLGGGSHAVRALSHGAYIMLEGRNLQNINAVSYRVAATLGGVIELRADAPGGTLINSVNVPSTGSLSNWVNIEAPLTNPGGKHDLYLVFKKNTGDVNLFDLNYIEFKGPGISIDNTPPIVSAVQVASKTQLNVLFSEPLDKTSAQQVANYSINNGITVSAAVLQADRKTVSLTTSTIPSPGTHELTVKNIKNESGVALSSITASFKLEDALFRINAGGPAVEVDGVQWSQNQYNSGGYTYANTSLAIDNTTADALYQTELYGTFSYNVPLASGTYLVRLHFAEIYFGVGGIPGGAGKRVFNVTGEGQALLTNFDVFAQAGGALKALVKEFEVSVTDGTLNLAFQQVTENPKVSAIEVVSKGQSTPTNSAPVVAYPIPDQSGTAGSALSFTFAANAFSDADGDPLSYSASLSNGSALPSWLSFNASTRTFSGTPSETNVGLLTILVKASDGKGGTASDAFDLTVKTGGSTGGGTTAVRINAGGAQFTAGSGTVFSADQHSSGGYTYAIASTTDVAGTTDDALYRTERYGTFSYNVPLASGTYLVRLHFAEIYFGVGGIPGGAGKRVFNVTGEGQALLTNFDVFAQAGGALKALVKEFEVSVTDGTLNLAFQQVTENPKVSAIEIVPITSTMSLSSTKAAVASEDVSLVEDVLVTVYPNPFDKVVNVRVQSGEPQGYLVKVYDLAGRVLYKNYFKIESPGAGALAIDFTNSNILRKEVYLISVEAVRGSYRKVIKVLKE
ncbi:putative secreted protein (Por secretion system target) [Pontibacter ummariensis]|uniref:Por secretion system C-terminal sorting domain-containing protein n=1 Tax=Pontibacter ummariensis TaxID=1610492 RepID=A0A239K448_9BACT|nr:malectin domain-containing carbohydrate-binding protein [Pontibacter ummariensis]PRY06781.1 putative secreted protein (Por secretion system target) [Pontibacter ummariensis]SNT12781.1 Por secretion system C-terminal sorting domain-containing protein [Pontibacter ummariensis]